MSKRELQRRVNLGMTCESYRLWHGLMRVGVAIPCHVRDRGIFLRCQDSLRKLDPQPAMFSVCFNEGVGGLKRIVAEQFDYLFEQDCDVVLKASADFYLSRHILSFVSPFEVVSFTPLARRFFDFSFALHRVFLRQRTWSGCYSLPRHVWSEIRGRFDGTDTSVMKAVGRWRVKSFQYQLLRPYGEESTRKLLLGFPLWKRFVWQLVRLKAVKVVK